jgi:hypothetical protein
MGPSAAAPRFESNGARPFGFHTKNNAIRTARCVTLFYYKFVMFGFGRASGQSALKHLGEAIRETESGLEAVWLASR